MRISQEHAARTQHDGIMRDKKPLRDFQVQPAPYMNFSKVTQLHIGRAVSTTHFSLASCSFVHSITSSVSCPFQIALPFCSLVQLAVCLWEIIYYSFHIDFLPKYLIIALCHLPPFITQGFEGQETSIEVTYCAYVCHHSDYIDGTNKAKHRLSLVVKIFGISGSAILLTILFTQSCFKWWVLQRQ